MRAFYTKCRSEILNVKQYEHALMQGETAQREAD